MIAGTYRGKDQEIERKDAKTQRKSEVRCWFCFRPRIFSPSSDDRHFWFSSEIVFVGAIKNKIPVANATGILLFFAIVSD